LPALGNEPPSDGELVIEDAGADASSTPNGPVAAVIQTDGWYPSADDRQQYRVNNLPLRSTWHFIEGSWYYFEAQAKYVENRWLFTNGYWYYFGADGRMLSSTITQIDSVIYLFNNTGAVIAAWLVSTDNTQLDSDPLNSSGATTTSWQLIKGKWYYFAPEQKLLPNANLMPSIYMTYGTHNIDNIIFELNDTSGIVMKTGWSWENDAWYYRNLESGRKVTSDWLQFDDYRYYLGADGKRLSSTISQIGSSTYAFDDEGVMITGWGKSPDDVLYYFDSSGAAVSGWQYIGDNQYYFASQKHPLPDSYLSPGIYMAYGRQHIDTAYYLLGEPDDGSMKIGWHYFQDSLNYYFGDGVMATGDFVYAPSTGNPSYSNFASDGQWLGYATSSNHNPAWGMTYAEVNLTIQYMWFFQDGVCVLECEVVTGNPNRGWATPTGTFYILSKSRNVIMSGADYRVFVSYWMPFTSAGHGFHDATWQPSFGGDAYTYRGSHGCINMPPWAGEQLYGLTSPGTPVVIHF